MSARRVLVIDDDAALRFALGKALRRRGFEVLEADGGTKALAVLSADDPPEVAILDLRMRDMDGLEVLRRRKHARTRVLVLTGHGTVQAAVEAMKLGAFSFLEKPVDADVLVPMLEQAIHDVDVRGDRLPAELEIPIVGSSSAVERVRAFVARVAPSDETVTVFGETGTGKEVVARQIHATSPRRNGPFVALNAACVPRDLFESELFGHRRGSFTGATADRPGLFREAHGGTLFIDELGELPIDSQAKLLRALESKMVRPVGEAREFAVDVRIVAATNRDLAVEVQLGRFREDLYYRLQVFPVVLPPLRDRLSDVPELAEHLVRRLGPNPPRLGDDVSPALMSYEWPGNVRELLNVLRRASLFAEDGFIDAELIHRMVSASIFGQTRSDTRRIPTPPPPSPSGSVTLPAGAAGGGRSASATPAGASLAEVERAHIEQVLAAMDGNVTKAATALGIDRRTLQRKLKAFGLSTGD